MLVSFFRICKGLLGKSRKQRLPSHSSSTELVNRFSDAFVIKIEDIYKDIANNSAQFEQSDSIPEMEFNSEMLSIFSPVSQAEIAKLISDTKITSCDLDPLPVALFKGCITVLIPAITQIVNCSLRSGVFPKVCKTALVKPLLKKPNMDINSMKSYRPVSNLSLVGKLIERIVDKKLSAHISSFNLHDPYQSAYRGFHSTETALLKVQDDVMRSLDSGKVVMLVLLDLSAAFDTVSHQKLLQRLNVTFGVSGLALDWFKSYLSDRRQCVHIDGVSSEFVDLRYGVPQGSVLGPKLFCVYTRPLGGIVIRHDGVEYHIYADDTQLYIEICLTNPDEPLFSISTINRCISDIQRWMCENSLKLNNSKTELLFFGSPRNMKKLESMDIHFTVGTDVITPSATARNLGVIQDNSLTMKPHVSRVCNEGFRLLHCIRRIRPYLSQKACCDLVQSLIFSKVDYGNVSLCGANKATLQPLQRFQNVCARVVTKVSKRSHITPSFMKLHWLPVEKRVKYKVVLLVFKILHGMAPGYLSSLLTPRTFSRHLRSSNEVMFEIPKFRTETYGRGRFGVKAAILWNNLPKNLRNCNSVAQFKKLLKHHYFRQTYF